MPYPMQVLTAYDREVRKHLNFPNHYDQIPFKFPDQTHQTETPSAMPNLFPLDATLKSISNEPEAQLNITMVIEDTVVNATQQTLTEATQKALTEVTQKALTEITQEALTEATQKALTEVTQEALTEATQSAVAVNNATSIGENITSIINDIFVDSNSTSNSNVSTTEATVQILDNSTEFELDLRTNSTTDFGINTINTTDLGSFFESTSKNDTRHQDGHHFFMDHTAILILGIVIFLLVVSVVVGLIIYFRKKKLTKHGRFVVQSYPTGAMNTHVNYQENLTGSLDGPSGGQMVKSTNTSTSSFSRSSHA